MGQVLLTAYLLIVLALIAVILLQRSEGGGLGMGSSSGGLISVRGSANLLTRTTGILATLFFVSAIGLSILSELDGSTDSILQQATDSVGTGVQAGPVNVLDALNNMGAAASDLPVPGATTAPATTPSATQVTTPSAVPAATSTSADPGLAVPAVPAAAPTTTAPAN